MRSQMGREVSSWPRSQPERGMALVGALMAMMLLTALGVALMLVSSIETAISAYYRAAQEGLHVADAGIERALQDLLLAPSWTDILAGGVTSSFIGSTTAPTLPDGSTLDLATETARLQREIDSSDLWGSNNPVWRLYAYGPLARLAPTGVGSAAYVAIWVADDPADGEPDAASGDSNPLVDSNGILTLRAKAYGAMGVRRTVEATVLRAPAAGLDDGQAVQARQETPDRDAGRAADGLEDTGTGWTDVRVLSWRVLWD